MNLCVNARDEIPDGGILSIYAENIYWDEQYAQLGSKILSVKYVRISVKDTGIIGVTPEVKEKIFDPFSQQKTE